MLYSKSRVFTKWLALALTLILAMGCFAGCAENKEPAGTEPETSSAATEPEGSSAATQPTETAPEQPKTVEYSHYGLYIKLPQGFTAGVSQDDPNRFCFDNGRIQGAAEFGELEQVTGGVAETSRDYAQYLLDSLGEEYEEAWIGSSTGICYYLVLQNEDSVLVRGLYVHDGNAWNVWAQSEDTALAEQLIRLVARCGMVPDEVPD